MIGGLLRFLFGVGLLALPLFTASQPVFASGSCLERPLLAGEVQTILQNAAAALDRPNMTIAVVDRPGNILGIYRKPATDPRDQDLAVSLARTGAFFSNEQAPLSSRTVRFISGKHFPPGIKNTPNAALYGIENTNRGCELNFNFDPGKDVPRARSFLGGPCRKDSTSGCGLGITTGKNADVVGGVPFDQFDNSGRVNPGGVPIYRDCNLVGGIGVVVRDQNQTPAQLLADHAEFAAATGASTPGFQPFPLIGISLANLVVFLDGIQLPFLDQTSRPTGESPADPASPGGVVLGPSHGTVTPEGYLLSPRAGSQLTALEVDRIVQQSIQTANAARAGIRLPLGSRTRMMIAVGDTDGTILAVYRMPDATIFSIDVAIAKARNVAYFSSSDANVMLDLPGVPLGTAITNRTLSFGAQPLYPPGIDGTPPAPFFDLFLRDTNNPCSQGFQTANPLNQSGIVFFPGSVPLYKNGVLVCGLGISGDGVEQDDVVSNGGGEGFLPATSIRPDRVSIRGVRLPWLKFNRNPFR